MPANPWLPPPIAEGVEWQLTRRDGGVIVWCAYIGSHPLALSYGGKRVARYAWSLRLLDLVGDGPTYAAALSALRAELAPLRVLL